ncbi:MAG: Tad domain-containing protein, partial [Bdellovibrionales bacterium]|nr:Tad domain-containing protein [Bdellovibrionales bacterium]
MIKSNRGQLSIFMGVTLILVMSMLAFIINVGLFVKAKINLQNAVDAAAFSGAATQARPLTNIAYVNWEMRNTYKEWMIKYYILGQLGLMKQGHNLTDAALAGNTSVSFLLKNIGSAGTAASVGFDKYNVPSICVHNNSSTNICPIFSLPGIPRFPAIGVAGISDVHTAFVNTLILKKGENCSARTQTNYLAALSWAYSSGIKEIPGAPLIATNRAGAWPETLELAMRMRNLEMIMNRPAVSDIDISKAQGLGQTGSDIGLNERPVKAYMSALRNLGGGKYKDAMVGGNAETPKDELAATFRLTEISPQPFIAEEKSVSGFLIPNSFEYTGETSVKAFSKPYVDLQIVPLNLATMFSTFATTKTKFDDGEEVDMEASCGVSKTALPVPGYIMGFTKNPQVITYYAVKGEAEFTGLFFPRSSSDSAGSFKLTAYAAAKPFGGRIGPRLFSFSNAEQSVVARDDDDKKSSSYISGIDVGLGGIGTINFVPGMPIPSAQTFWVDDFHPVIGGVPETNSSDIAYAVPNMIYDFNSSQELDDQKGAAIGKIQMISAVGSPNAVLAEKRGLYNPYQMRELKKALGGNFAGTNMSSADLMRALVTSRQVTKYDAANYLIPDFHRSTSISTNAAPTVKAENAAVPGGKGIYYKLFAPLIGDQLLYKTSPEIGTIVMSYMSSNSVAIDLYLESLLRVANSIFSIPPAAGVNTNGQNINELAAKSIHVNANGTQNLNPKVPPLLVSADPMDSNALTCKKDMASKFNHFFRGENTQCGIVPLELLMIE